MSAQFQLLTGDGESCFHSLLLKKSALIDQGSLHYHPEWELCLVACGSGKRYIGDDVGRFDAGDVFVIGPNIPHSLVCDEQGGCEIFFLQFRDSCLGEHFLAAPELRKIKQFTDQQSVAATVDGANADIVRQVLPTLTQLSGLPRLIAFFQLIDCMLSARDYQLISCSPQRLDMAGGRLAKVDLYIRSSIGDDIRQRDVAEHVAMTPQGFSRFFRAATGGTFVAYVNSVRVAEACQQLAATDDSIVDVAYRCGYKNLSSFYHRFSLLKHCTPREYRDACRPSYERVSS